MSLQVSGGPYGVEDAVKNGGPLLALLGFTFFPLVSFSTWKQSCIERNVAMPLEVLDSFSQFQKASLPLLFAIVVFLQCHLLICAGLACLNVGCNFGWVVSDG